MLAVTLLSVVSLALSAGADFDDNYAGYRIMFHDGEDLLTVIHGDMCYFVWTPDSVEDHLATSGPGVTSPLHLTESSLLSHIWRNSSGEVKPSSIQAVRDQFSDLLADFVCLGKRIYIVDYFSGFITTTPQSPIITVKTTPGDPITTTTTTTNNNNNQPTTHPGASLNPTPVSSPTPPPGIDTHLNTTMSSTSSSNPGTATPPGVTVDLDAVCALLPYGRHPYPSDCRKFLICTPGPSLAETCPAGMVYRVGAGVPCVSGSCNNLVG